MTTLVLQAATTKQPTPQVLEKGGASEGGAKDQQFQQTQAIGNQAQENSKRVKSLHTYLSNHKTKATKAKAKRQTQRVTGAQDSGQTN